MLKIKAATASIICLLCSITTACTPIGKYGSDVANATQETEQSLVLINTHLSGWVVYSDSTSPESFDIQIFLQNLDTGDTRQLTYSGDNSFPKWSPDGSKILFVSHTKENSDDIYIMDKDGSNQHPLIATAADETFPDWSPDGSKIVFSSNQGGDSQIYTMELESKKITQLTKYPIILASLPTWSSNGMQIAFQASIAGEANRPQIYITDIDDNNVVRVTNYDVYTFDGGPVWCPDDTCLIFSRDTGGGSKLMLVDLATKRAEPLLKDIFDATSMQTSIRHSPASNYLTFVVDREYYAFDMVHREIYPLHIVDVLDVSLNP